MNQMDVSQVMQQMRATAARLDQAHSNAIKPIENVAPGAKNFATTLADAATAVSASQKTAAAGAAAVEAGHPDASLPDVMLQLQKADLSFRAMTEVRNKLVNAYQEIMNMPV
ncbi:MAG: flagellar hook-basal body complex protein FliE [Gammaproteobacteria bacterium]